MLVLTFFQEKRKAKEDEQMQKYLEEERLAQEAKERIRLAALEKKRELEEKRKLDEAVVMQK